MDSKALFTFSYGLYVVSAKDGERESACIANTLAQVTSSPVRLSVALNKNNYTTGLIQASGRFSAAVLSEETEMNTIANFGFQSGKDTDKFRVPCMTDGHGLRLPTDGMIAHVSCRVIETMDLGTHILFVGEMDEAETVPGGRPMTYAYYHSVKKGTTPKNAPSYQEAAPKKGFRCTVCGYFVEADSLPEDFRCPICKVGRDKFERIG